MVIELVLAEITSDSCLYSAIANSRCSNHRNPFLRQTYFDQLSSTHIEGFYQSIYFRLDVKRTHEHNFQAKQIRTENYHRAKRRKMKNKIN